MNENENTTLKFTWWSQPSTQREIYRYKCLHLKKNDIVNNLTFYFKELEEEKTKPKANRSKDIKRTVKQLRTTRTTKSPEVSSLKKSAKLTNILLDRPGNRVDSHH